MRSLLILQVSDSSTIINSYPCSILKYLSENLIQGYLVTVITLVNQRDIYLEVRRRANLLEIFVPDTTNSDANSDISGSRSHFSNVRAQRVLSAASTPASRFRQIARKYAQSSEIILHASPFTESTLSSVDGSEEFYLRNSNFIADLSLTEDGMFDAQGLKAVIEIESRLIARCKFVFVPSATDAAILEIFYGANKDKFLQYNSGPKCDSWNPISTRSEEDPSLTDNPGFVFEACSSEDDGRMVGYIEDLALRVPEAKFTVIESGSHHASYSSAENFNRICPLTQAERLKYYSNAIAYISPFISEISDSSNEAFAIRCGVRVVVTNRVTVSLSACERGLVIRSEKDEFDKVVSDLFRQTEFRTEKSNDCTGDSSLFFTKNMMSVFINAFESHEYAPICTSKILLFLNDYDVTAVLSGGSARIIGILKSLDKTSVLLSFGKQFNINMISDKVLSITIPKTAKHVQFDHTLNFGQRCSAGDIASSICAPDNIFLVSTIQHFMTRCSCVIFEHCYMASLLTIIRDTCPSVRIVYSAHNAEYHLKKDLLLGSCIYEDMISYVGRIEKMLIENSDLVVCCTDEDARLLQAPIDKIVICGNGVEALSSTELVDYNQRREKFICGFIASSHPPNISAALYIVRDLAPALPQINFEIVGSVCMSLPGYKAENVVLLGCLSEERKNRAMGRWSIALNPCFAGGGSSLKLADYLSKGVPVLATPIGARGYKLEEYRSGVVVGIDFLCDVLRQIYHAQESLRDMSENALNYANAELTWSKRVRIYSRRLDALRENNLAS